MKGKFALRATQAEELADLHGTLTHALTLFRTGLTALAISLAVVASAQADEYPSRPIRVIVATSPGGVSDVFIRSLGEELRRRLGQPLVIENRSGGNFNIGTKACAQAAADGYTLCVLPGEAVTYNLFLFKNLNLDPTQDIAPITNLFFITQVMAVQGSLKVNELSGLAALAKANPGTLNYAAPGLSHALFIENFDKQIGGGFVRVPFRGGADAVNGLLSGTTPIIFLGLGNVLGQLSAGSASALLVDGAERSPLLPNVKTLSEIGYTGDITRSYFGLFAPGRTPDSIIGRLHTEIAAIMVDQEFLRKNLRDRGLEPALSTPKEFNAFLEKDRAAAGRVVEASGLKPQ